MATANTTTNRSAASLGGTEVLDEASHLADDMLALSRDELLTSIRFVNRPLAQLPMRIQMDRGGCMTDGREALFSPAFVLDAFRGARHVIARAYLHMILHCLLRHPFPAVTVDPLTWSVACDLAVGCAIGDLDCDAIAVADPKRDETLALWRGRVERPTATAFYALLQRENLPQEKLAEIEIVVGMDSHELWFTTPDGVEEQESTDQQDVSRQLEKRWEEIAAATEMDMQRNPDEAPSSLDEQLKSTRASAMSLDELLRIYAAPRETMRVSDEEFDYIYYSYGLSELNGIALVEPLEYCETPQLRNFCIAIDTSGSCSGPRVKAFVAKACGMLLESAQISDKTRIWLVQCDDRVQDVRKLSSREDVVDVLESYRVKGLGGTDFRPVFNLMDDMLERGEVDGWEALIYFTDGQGTYPDDAPPYDAAFVFVDEPGACPAWATSAITYSDELEESLGAHRRHETESER